MRRVASISPLLRVRFATSHPKDISDRLLEVMAEMPNICRAIHLPAQSGASSMLARMNRKYTREWYLDRVAAIRRYLPELANVPDRYIHAPWMMDASQQSACGVIVGRDTPSPIVEHDAARRATLARYAVVKRAAAS